MNQQLKIFAQRKQQIHIFLQASSTASVLLNSNLTQTHAEKKKKEKGKTLLKPCRGLVSIILILKSEKSSITKENKRLGSLTNIDAHILSKVSAGLLWWSNG